MLTLWRFAMYLSVSNDDDDCFKVAQASRHSGYPRSASRDKIVSTQ